jgi:hypothetical protein
MKGIQQEATERTEKIDLKAPFFPGEHRVHPLSPRIASLFPQLPPVHIQERLDRHQYEERWEGNLHFLRSDQRARHLHRENMACDFTVEAQPKSIELT